MPINNNTPNRRVGDLQIGILIGQFREFGNKVDYITTRLDTHIAQWDRKCNGRHFEINSRLNKKVDKQDTYRTIKIAVSIVIIALVIIEIFVNVFFKGG